MAFQAHDPGNAALLRRRKALALSLVVLAAFLAWQALLLKQWLSVDTRPPSWDQSIHLEIALDYKDAIAAGRWSEALHPAPKSGMPAFPPLYHLALQPALASADPARAALWVNFAYFAALVLCLFGLVFEFRDDFTAAAAAVAFASAPGVQDLLYTQLVDLPVLACSTAAYWAFLRSATFSRWAPSLAFGALYAAGMLHKWSFFSYMIPVYVVAARLLRRPKASKGPMLAAAALAFFLAAPWYAANWPLLLPRLFQASADFAVPVWRGGAFFSYLVSSVDGLGPGLWVMGWIGMLLPRYKRNEADGWLLSFWVVSSYVFWAIVPNRQLRFLLPGLPGLAVAACGSWPTPMIWGLLGLQLFGAANFSRGWLGPMGVPTPLGVATLFSNRPPAAEEWRIDEILREAERRRDPVEPVANLTLVANHRYFNGPTFTWRRRALGLPHVRIRGVNRRLCEFSQFLALKDGDLGPASVIGGLPEAAKIVRSSRWFSRAFEKVAQWPLPDGSEAILYERAKPKSPPFKAGALTFQYYTHAPFSATDMRVDLGRWDATAGLYPKARVAVKQADFRGLRLSDVKLEFDGLLMVPANVPPRDEWDELRFLKLSALRVVSASVEAEGLRRFLEQRLPGLRLDTLKLDETVKAAGSFRSAPVSVELAVERQEKPRALRLRLLSLKLGPTSIPVGAINRIKELTVSLEPNAETPFAVDLPGLTLRDDRLSVP